MKKVIYLDLDDFGEKNNRLDWLWRLSKEFPHFKVNLFAIPTQCPNDFIDYVGAIPWLRLYMHGYHHVNNEEIGTKFLQNRGRLHQYYLFHPVYKAPYWQLSDKMYNRLTKLKYKIMLHPDDSRDGIKFNWNIKDSPPFLKTLYGHGHIQNTQGNGLVEAFENIMKLPKDIKFKFL